MAVRTLMNRQVYLSPGIANILVKNPVIRRSTTKFSLPADSSLTAR